VNGFINHILNRHLQPENNIKPRVPGRFETFTSAKQNHEGIIVVESDESNGSNEAQTQNKNEGSFQKSSVDHEKKYDTSIETPKNSRNVILDDLKKGPFEKKQETYKPDEPDSATADDNKGIPDSSLITPENLISADGRSHLIDTEHIYSIHEHKVPFKEKETASNQNSDARPLTYYPEKGKAPLLNNFYGHDDKLEKNMPPAIKISIGRIEVRAIISPTPEKKNTISSQKPDMTLDDYLKKRKDNSQ